MAPYITSGREAHPTLLTFRVCVDPLNSSTHPTGRRNTRQHRSLLLANFGSRTLEMDQTGAGHLDKREPSEATC